jgi:hypothetical protein
MSIKCDEAGRGAEYPHLATESARLGHSNTASLEE